MTEGISKIQRGLRRSRRVILNGPVVVRKRMRVILIGTHGPIDFEPIVRRKGRLLRVPGRRDTWMEPSAPDTTVPPIRRPQETIMKTNNVTLTSRNRSVMAGIDKQIPVAGRTATASAPEMPDNKPQ
jgi:hypothetical protein